MSTAPLSICTECQVLHCVPALNVNSNKGYLRWAYLDKWQARFSMSHCSGSFQNDTCIKEFDWWWVRGYNSPSGSKNLQVDSRTEEELEWERTLVTSQADSSSLQTPIYGSLSHEIQRLECCNSKELLLFCDQNHWMFMIWKGVKIGTSFAGRRRWIGALWVVTLLKPLLLINKVIWFAPICWCLYDVCLHWCIWFI